MSRELTGRHVAAIFGGAFAVIIAVNVALAVSAVGTFPGLVVKNSYVASQEFELRRDAQDALDWTVAARVEGGRLHLAIDGPDGPVEPAAIKARIGRATFVAEDREPDLVWTGAGYEADLPGLAPGQWVLWLEAEAEDGTAFSQRIPLRVAG